MRDFRGSVLATAGIEVVTPPKLFERWLDSEPVAGKRVVEAMAAGKTRPPMTVEDVIGRIARQQGFSKVASRLTGAIGAEPEV